MQFPCTQGLLRHSFTREKQLGWWGPSGHRQRKPFTSLTHVAPLRQGLEAHSSMSTLHRGPVEEGDGSVRARLLGGQAQDRDMLCGHRRLHGRPAALI